MGFKRLLDPLRKLTHKECFIIKTSNNDISNMLVHDIIKAISNELACAKQLAKGLQRIRKRVFSLFVNFGHSQDQSSSAS